jgi:hypothetical protein
VISYLASTIFLRYFRSTWQNPGQEINFHANYDLAFPLLGAETVPTTWRIPKKIRLIFLGPHLL